MHLPSLPLIVLVASASFLHAEETPEMASKAEAFLAGLKPEQKEKAAFPFTSEERLAWGFVPKARNGIPFNDLDETQRKAAMALLHSGLSEKGRMKAEAIIALESILAAIEKNPTYRDPGKYCVSIFGIPNDPKGWGWRFEGHHLSLNFAITKDRVAVTPTFMGSNPAEVRVEGPSKGKRALAPEEDLARALAAGLAESGKPVVFSDKAPAEILTSDKRKVEQLEAVGIPDGEMTEAQKAGLEKLIGEYVDRYRKDVADVCWKKIKDAGIEKIRFGWAGGLKPNEAFYYRIQGPTFLIEVANTQNNANHMHTVWRDFDGDFGRDFLGDHYQGHEK